MLLSKPSLLATATVLALAGLGAAELLALVEAKPGAGGVAGCSAVTGLDGPSFTIMAFDEHIAEDDGKRCHDTEKWKALAQGTKLEGCDEGYSNGYGVCLTGYGANIHDGKGKHQRCSEEQVRISQCINPEKTVDGKPCPVLMDRVLKCDGNWVDDA